MSYYDECDGRQVTPWRDFFFFLRLKCGSDCTHAFFPRDLLNRGPSPALVTDLAVVEKLFEKGMKKKKHSLELLFLTTVSSIGRLARLLLLPMIAFLFLSPVTNKKTHTYKQNSEVAQRSAVCVVRRRWWK